MFAKGTAVKRTVACIALICAAGCGVGSDRAATGPPVTLELAPVETVPGTVPPIPSGEQSAIPFAYADPAATSSAFSAAIPIGSGSVDVLGALLDALLFEMLAPVGPQFLAPGGPRLNDSMTFLERLCLEGDDTDTYCRQRFSR